MHIYAPDKHNYIDSYKKNLYSAYGMICSIKYKRCKYIKYKRNISNMNNCMKYLTASNTEITAVKEQ